MRQVALLTGLLGALLATAPATAAEPLTPPDARRAPDQTYLTYPEWFLVFSPEEYADWVVDRPPSRFPFLGHTAQLWQGYAAAAGAVPSEEPVNVGYHVMILVIATSTSAEYALRAAYESSIGAFAEALETSGPSAEERYGAKVARDYERFLRQEPWYKFDYVAALTGLWTDVPLLGPSPLRGWERRYALTTEYVAKAAYAAAIGFGTAASYDPALPSTVVVIDAPPRLGEVPGVTDVQPLGTNATLATLPRYEAFAPAAVALARQGAKFVEIAGNRGTILVSARVPTGSSPPGALLFRQPMLTRPGVERVLLATPVAELGPALLALDAPGITLEHVYDF